jgi:hypothetical protein
MIRSCYIMAALLATFLQGSSAGHMLLVEHVRCAEHGELVHPGESHGHGTAAPGDIDRATVGARSSASSELAHAHCALASNPREVAVEIARSRADSAHEHEAAGRKPVVRYDDVDESSRFRLAPKNSPPT